MALRGYCDRHGLQDRAARALKMSAGMVSQMLTGDWDRIDDRQWLAVAVGVGLRQERWEAVETAGFAALQQILADAQAHSLAMSIMGAAGSGKTFAARYYAQTHLRAWVLSCDSYWTRKDLMEEMLRVMGEDVAGLTLAGMVERAVRRLRMQDQPLLVFDEADKLGDQVLCSLITLYNWLEGICEMVLVATSHLEKKLVGGVRLNKQGYNELWSRLGRKCIGLVGVSVHDIARVCEANGVSDPQAIDVIIVDSDSDLRRVARKVHAWQWAQKKKGGSDGQGV